MSLSRFQLPYMTTTQREAIILNLYDWVMDTDLGYPFVGDGVTYGGNAATGPQGIPGTNGTDGISIVWHGTYNNSHAYIVNDSVSYLGSTYICILATTGNGNPDGDPTHWDLMAQRGTDGSGTGDVVGPAVAVDGHFALFDTTTGKLIKESGISPGDKQDTLGFTPENSANKDVSSGYPSMEFVGHPGIRYDYDITNSSGLVTVPANTGWFRVGEEILSFAISGITNHVLTDDIPNYVVADYNSGSPVFDVITNELLIDYETILPYAEVFKRTGSNNLHTQMILLKGRDAISSIHHRIAVTDRYAREEGALANLSVDTSLNISLDGGAIWAANYQYILAAVTVATRQFVCENTNGVWTITSNTTPVLDNTQYNDPITGFQTLTDTYWSVTYLYRGIEDEDHVYTVLGEQYASLELAQASNRIALLPALITSHAMLVGRIIVQKGTTTGIVCESAFDTVFAAASPVTNHASMSNLDFASSGHTGFEPAKGTDDNYVTDAEKVIIGNTSGVNSGNQTDIPNSDLAQMVTKTYKGRTAGTTGDPEDVSVATLKTDLSLNNVDNTSDASKPVSTAQQTALDLKLDDTQFSGLAKISVGTSTPSTPTTGDLWVDTN
jgi:hypothetical protein